MNPRNMLRRAWRKFELFAYAMDHDDHIDAASRIEQLDQLQQSHSAALAAVEERVSRLAADVTLLSR